VSGKRDRKRSIRADNSGDTINLGCALRKEFRFLPNPTMATIDAEEDVVKNSLWKFTPEKPH